MKRCTKCGHICEDSNFVCPICMNRLETLDQPMNVSSDLQSSQTPKQKKKHKEKKKRNRGESSELEIFGYDTPQYGMPDDGTGFLQPPSQKKGIKKKTLAIILGAVAVVVAAAIVLSSIFLFPDKSDRMVSVNSTQKAATQTNNVAAFKDTVNVITKNEPSKKLKDVEYDAQTQQYTMTYSTLPACFKTLQQGDVFAVAADEEAKQYFMQTGFSGVVQHVDENSISFTIPDFADLFDKFELDSSEQMAETVMFVPEEGVEMDYSPNLGSNTASIGLLSSSTNNFKIGDYSAEVHVDKASRESALEDYTILADEVSLKIKRERKDKSGLKVEVTGSVKLKNPAVKFKVGLDSSAGGLKSYDVGLITEQSVSIKTKVSKNPNNVEDDSKQKGEFGIIDLKDVTDLEKDKIILGSCFLGYSIPFKTNEKNKMPLLGIGIPIQICLNTTGNLEFECGLEESSLLCVEKSSQGAPVCRFLQKDSPNPVLGETESSSGTTKKGIESKTTIEGDVDLNSALSIDVGFSVLGTIPFKLATDVVCLELTANAKYKDKQKLVFDTSQTIKAPIAKKVDFLQIRSQATLKINLGGSIVYQEEKADVGKYGIQITFWNKVWKQIPEPEEFSLDVCDFGGIHINAPYTEDEMDEAFYGRLSEMGIDSSDSSNQNAIIQSTLKKLIGGLNYDIKSILDIFPLKGEYTMKCYAEGAIYFSQNGNVKAALITGDGVYNSSNISAVSNEKFIRGVYSQPNTSISTDIEIGMLGSMLLEKIGLEEIAELDGTSVDEMQYISEDGAHMDVYLHKEEIVCILVYVK